MKYGLFFIMLILSNVAFTAQHPVVVNLSKPASYIETHVPAEICIKSQCSGIRYFWDQQGFVVAVTHIKGKTFLGWPRVCLYKICKYMLENAAENLKKQVTDHFPSAEFGRYGNLESIAF